MPVQEFLEAAKGFEDPANGDTMAGCWDLLLAALADVRSRGPAAGQPRERVVTALVSGTRKCVQLPESSH